MIQAGIVEAAPTSHTTVLGWEVDDINAVVNRLGAAGVKSRKMQSKNQDDFFIWTAPRWFKGRLVPRP